MQRLTAEDQVMLWPDERWPQDIGALAVLDGGPLLDPDGGFRIEVAREAVARRLHRVPRFRQLLYVPPRRLGGPLWVDAASFELAEHVRTCPVPPPGDEAQLLLVTERLRRERLDRSRPLWQMWFLTGLPDRRVALFVRMHHAIADGMAGVATMAQFLDTGPGATADPPQPSAPQPSAPQLWTPQPPPTDAELLDDERRRARRHRRDTVRALTHPAATARRALAAWPAVRDLLFQRPLPATSLDRLVGADRRLALIHSRLEPIRQAAHAHHATVNDVLLAATGGGLRALLRGRGEPVDGVVARIYVPVSLHREPRAQARGNLIAQIVVPLPLGVADPARRLARIAAETAGRKARSQPSLGGLPTRGLAGLAFLKLVKRQRVNVTSADIPGPPAPLYFAGARLLDVFPMVQLLGTVSLAVGAMSYAGQFGIMVVADRDAYPDLDVFTAGMREELSALTSTAEHAAAAGGSRGT